MCDGGCEADGCEMKGKGNIEIEGERGCEAKGKRKKIGAVVRRRENKERELRAGKVVDARPNKDFHIDQRDKRSEGVEREREEEEEPVKKNCLGALNGTYIRVRVPENDKPRYRTRKGEIATNVLGVCSRDMKFIFVMPGWEGSAFDSRILRDAIRKPTGLRVPTGYYYLVDAGYSNAEGFLAPYRGTRYHLSEWRDGREMSVDPLEHELLEIDNNEVQDASNITTLEASDQWTGWRNDLADAMYNEWLGNHR
ncbi:DDE Tnp4 domain-containing protein [Citrus sinensis]|uniref:DDE Tnp4 domain-containing protein n=1 Tax=Citrus sinensis TaxID=2711 RepID=A0ACB8N8Q9_CITSI|nr:DDE Tnp4 domain-containing protein [Citrus sinensis]